MFNPRPNRGGVIGRTTMGVELPLINLHSDGSGVIRSVQCSGTERCVRPHPRAPPTTRHHHADSDVSSSCTGGQQRSARQPPMASNPRVGHHQSSTSAQAESTVTLSSAEQRRLQAMKAADEELDREAARYAALVQAAYTQRVRCFGEARTQIKRIASLVNRTAMDALHMESEDGEVDDSALELGEAEALAAVLGREDKDEFRLKDRYRDKDIGEPPAFSSSSLTRIFEAVGQDAAEVRLSTEQMLRVITDPQQKKWRVGSLEGELTRSKYHAAHEERFLVAAVNQVPDYYTGIEIIVDGAREEVLALRRTLLDAKEEIDTTERHWGRRQTENDSLRQQVDAVRKEIDAIKFAIDSNREGSSDPQWKPAMFHLRQLIGERKSEIEMARGGLETLCGIIRPGGDEAMSLDFIYNILAAKKLATIAENIHVQPNQSEEAALLRKKSIRTVARNFFSSSSTGGNTPSLAISGAYSVSPQTSIGDYGGHNSPALGQLATSDALPQAVTLSSSASSGAS